MLILIPIGITTKLYHGTGEGFIHNHLGGAIYVIFWIFFFSIFFPKNSYFKLTAWVFSVTCLIEFTQLIHATSLEWLREYFIVRALFGSAFNSYDFIWYFVGAIIGYIIITVLKANPKPRTIQHER